MVNVQLSKEGAMSTGQQLFDVAGRRRSPATLAEFHAGRAPGNKAQHYPADPPTVDENHRGHAPRPRDPLRQSPQRLDRRALARRATDPRSARAHRNRSGRAARVDPGQARQERPPSPGRDGRLGMDCARAMAHGARSLAGRSAVLRDLGTHGWARLVSCSRPIAAAPRRARGWRPVVALPPIS